MTNEEVMRILRTAAEKRMGCGMIDERAIEVLNEMIGSSELALTGEQLIALGFAAGRIEAGVREVWVKTKDKYPERGELILMAAITNDGFIYYTGWYDIEGDWVVQWKAYDVTTTILNDAPMYWRYLVEPENWAAAA